MPWQRLSRLILCAFVMCEELIARQYKELVFGSSTIKCYVGRLELYFSNSLIIHEYIIQSDALNGTT